jgi:hypothetical protein
MSYSILPWESASDDQLLSLRICDLGLTLEDSVLSERVSQLHAELREAGLVHLQPACYLGDEWFSTEGFTSISLPFYLARPRLASLERKMMLEAEGDSTAWCMKLLRHEAGHCFDHAYGCSKRRDWRAQFGSPQKVYAPEHFLARPYSRSFVQHLDNNYAQAHPDEDFAETFAVWLTPQSNWRQNYAQWQGALAKLQYVDELARQYAAQQPKVGHGSLPYRVQNLKRTLAVYYQRKQRENADDFPDYFDRDLFVLFQASAQALQAEPVASERKAAVFLRKSRSAVIPAVSRWTGARKYIVDALLRRIIKRCEQLDLRLSRDQDQVLVDFGVFMTAMVGRYLQTGRFRRSA